MSFNTIEYIIMKLLEHDVCSPEYYYCSQGGGSFEISEKGFILFYNMKTTTYEFQINAYQFGGDAENGFQSILSDMVWDISIQDGKPRLPVGVWIDEQVGYHPLNVWPNEEDSYFQQSLLQELPELSSFEQFDRIHKECVWIFPNCVGKHDFRIETEIVADEHHSELMKNIDELLEAYFVHLNGEDDEYVRIPVTDY